MVCKVYVVGIGMGNPATLTIQAQQAIAESGLIVGAQRMIDAFAELPCQRVAAVAPDAILAALQQSDQQVASVLMSGDVGFYSGATGLYPLLENTGMHVQVLPGISSPVYLCAQLHTTWQDAFLVSAHGRAHNAVGAVQAHAKTFLLTGGSTRVSDIVDALVLRGLGDVRVSVGERLSYDDENIVCGTASQLVGRDFADLSVMLVENDHPIAPEAGAPYLADDAFERGDVPMTKEEVRQLALCKLRIQPHHTVWDVGAGTGSVSIEAARAAREGVVYAIEKKPAAIDLLQANKRRFGLPNVQVVEGVAPAALAGLPAPDRVFVGGSSGQLQQVLACAIDANDAVRLCVSAITLETLGEALSCLAALGLRNVDIAQVSVAKSRDVGRYHMMMGQNPIYLISADGPAAGQEA